MSTYKYIKPCLFLVFLLAQMQLNAQCPGITVDAGPDKFVCNQNGMTTLEGDIGGTYLGFSWSPPTGLSSPNVLNPIATVTGPMTYTLSAQAFDPAAPNMLDNPDFESGNSGFTSQYGYDPMPITPGTYTLTLSPSLVNSNFPPCDDHTFGNGTGYMMLVNGNAVAGSQVYCQTVPVSPNTWYTMNGWAAASPISPPSLQFVVNGNAAGSPFPVASGCNWQQFGAAWFSGGATTAQVCIVDQISGGNGLFGDDYVLDDIYFAEACTATDQVMVDVADVDAVLPPNLVLPCNQVANGIDLDGSASTSGAGVTYSWDGPSIIGGANSPIATVNAPGTYTFTVSFDTGSGVCSESRSIEVLPDPNTVNAIIAVPGGINCSQATVTLDATASSSGGTVSYFWEPAANLVSGQGTPIAEVDEPGLYTLTVTNSISGCTATATALVEEDTATPTAAASAPTMLSCSASSVTLSGNGSTTVGVDYLWTGPGVQSGASSLNNCVVNAPGLYTLTVTNALNGCSATATATVSQDGSAATAIAAASGNLSCSATTATLNSTGSSSGANISYQWATPNGHFTSPTNQPTATVDSAGTYILIVTNTSNGCSATDTLAVAATYVLPTAAIAPPAQQLNCEVDSLQLNAAQSSNGMGFSFVWAAQNGGTFLNGQNTLTPWVGSAGSYVLTVTNAASGCTASASVAVVANTTPPIAQAGPNATLDCSGTAVSLNGTGSSTGSGISYQWTTTGGNIVMGDTTLTPEVNGVGTYYLMVENAANGCTALDSVAVAQDANAPTVVIAPAAQLDCDTDEVPLNATGSSTGPNITITWNGPSFAGGVNTLSPTVNQPGVYQLILFNQSNNCVANASVTVTIDTLAPLADAGPAPTLDCGNPAATLDGSSSSQGPNFSYLWSTSETTQAITVSNSGTYTLTVTNAVNGCSASDAVTVASFGNLPNVSIAPPASLNCTVTELQLSATAPTGIEYFYNWIFTGTGTGIVSGPGSLTPTIGSPGTYTLTVTNVQTGCSASESVLVAGTTNIPGITVNGTQTLFCGQTSIQINGVGLSQNGVSYLWTTQGGNIISGETTPNLMINAPGTYTLTVTDLQNGCTASDSVIVLQDTNAPTADAGAPQSLDCSMQQVTLDGTGSSSGPGITYLWTTTDGTIFAGANTLTPTVTAAGTYLLTVTNTQNNCQTLASVQVTDVAQQPTAVAITNQQLGCGTQPISLSGAGSSTGTVFNYLWTGPGVASGGTTLTASVNLPGVYTLTVTNLANNCTNTAQVTVVQNSTPPTAIAAAPQSITCLLQQVPLSGAGSSTGTGYGYLWQGPGIVSGGTTLTPTANAGGVYTLTVTGPNSCTATATTTVTSNTTPPTAIAAAPQGLGCGTQQVQLDGTGSSTGAGIFYLWQGPGIVSGQTTLTPTVNAPGAYTLTVANQANGCSATATATVTQNTSSVIAVTNAPQPLTCALTATSIDATGSSAGANIMYEWTGPGVEAGGDAILVSVNEPGTYTLTVTDQATGCTATTTAIVSANWVVPGVDAGPNQQLVCGASSLGLQGNTNAANFDLVWTTASGNIVEGEQTLTPTIDAPGTYFLELTNLNNGCVGIDSVVVSAATAIFPAPLVQQPTCAEATGSISFSGGQGGATPFVYSLDNGLSFDQDGLFEDLPSGNYIALVIDDNGCETEFVLIVAVATPLDISLAASVSVEEGGSVQLSPSLNIPNDEITSINWSPSEGLSCSDCLNPIATPTSDIVYTVEITSGVCADTASVSITVNVVVPSGGIYIPNIFSPNGDGINDVLTVFAVDKQVKTVTTFQVYSRWGEAVFQGFGLRPNDVTTGWDGKYRGKDVDFGVFAWYAEVELMTGEKKVVKGDVTVLR